MPVRIGRHSCSLQWQVGRRRPLRPLRAAANVWGLLGVGPGATREEVRQAFREKIKKAHPDAGGTAEEFRQLRLAYKTALEEVHTSSPQQTQSSSSSVGGSGEQPPDSQGWSIHDFYKWRREQVQTEYERWAKDADWHTTQEETWQKQWPGTEKRRRQEEAQRRAQQEERRATQAELNDALRQEQARASAARDQAREGRRRNRDLHKWDWESVVKPKRSSSNRPDADGSTGRARSPRRQPRRPSEDRDTVVSHRLVETGKGPVRVPVYQAAGGARYYHSPVTSKKVSLPR